MNEWDRIQMCLICPWDYPVNILRSVLKVTVFPDAVEWRCLRVVGEMNPAQTVNPAMSMAFAFFHVRPIDPVP